jgi:hypothetical protein
MRTRDGIESFIVRIYRRGEGDRTDLAGIVENTSQPESRPFRTREELHDVLDRMMKRPPLSDDEKGAATES